MAGSKCVNNVNLEVAEQYESQKRYSKVQLHQKPKHWLLLSTSWEASASKRVGKAVISERARGRSVFEALALHSVDCITFGNTLV